jgi:hypothetical protein
MRPQTPWILSALFTTGAAIAACSASNSSGSGGLGGNAGGNRGAGGGGAHHPGGGGPGSGGGITIHDGGHDAPGDVSNPCGSQCGSTELCDDAHLGFDDNCNGVADEGCPCTPGQAHWCFLGDPSYRNTPGCFDGVEKCTELGAWGPCVGGKQAVPPDNCQMANLQGCHSITAPPFATVDLKTGTGTFSANADAGSETWDVVCPAGVSPCPTPMGTPAENYTALQSGEYLVTYHKTVNGSPDSCDYSLFVGAPGLRVELTWEHPTNNSGVDLDLHMHQPMDTSPWAIDGVEQDCGWLNCKSASFCMTPQQGDAPSWFSDTAMPPMPVNWDLDPTPMKNTCYYAPNGHGAAWQSFGMGCHNPRLDTDDISCNASITDPTNGSFCAPENINIDYPPDSQWFRVGVHYFSNHGLGLAIHPEVKFYCDGALAGDLGSVADTNNPGMRDPAGYASVVTFNPNQGAQTDNGNVFWLVADVVYKPATMCVPAQCIVQPLFADMTAMTPYFEPDTNGSPAFGPPYPPIP